MKNELRTFYVIVDCNQLNAIESRLLFHKFFWNGKGYDDTLTYDERMNARLKNKLVISKSNETNASIMLSEYTLEVKIALSRAALKEVCYDDLKAILDKRDSINLYEDIYYAAKYQASKKKPREPEMFGDLEHSVSMSEVDKKYVSFPDKYYNPIKKEKSVCPVTPEFLRLIKTIQTNVWPDRLLVDANKSVANGRKQSKRFFSELQYKQRLSGTATFITNEHIKIITKKLQNELFRKDFPI